MEELDVMRIIDENLSKIQDTDVKNRILHWAWQKFSTEPIPDEIESKEEVKEERRRKKSTKKKSRQLKTKAKRPSIVGDLDLSKKGSKLSLKEFYAQYAPKSNLERNLIFCYYLQNIKKQSPITVDHVYTCYRDISKLKIPVALSQSLIDTAGLKGWLDTGSLEDISVTVHGINYIEHDMQKAESETT
jgi:hypothetical protein